MVVCMNRHWSDSLAQTLFRSSPVIVLDYYNVLAHSGYYHSMLNTPTHPDCTHYCWNQNLWSPFWGLVNYALFRNIHAPRTQEGDSMNHFD